MSAREVLFDVGSEGATKVLERLQTEFDGRLRRPETSDTTYVDTFDWRVFGSGASLAVSCDGAEVRWLEGEDELTARATSKPPAFAQDVGAGPLRKRLDRILEVRRVFPVAEVERRSHALDLIDREGKTVARVIANERSARLPENGKAASEWQDAPTILALRGVQGYDDEFGLVERFLRYGLSLPEHRTTELEDALTVLAVDPSPWHIASVDGRDEAEPATRKLLLGFLDAVEGNVAGTREDYDIEFLHDLRVATRRSRAVLSELDGVFLQAIRNHYASELRWLGDVTGPTRDLDVFLQELPGYRDLLPAHQRVALTPFVNVLHRRRASAWRQLTDDLNSDRFLSLRANWREYLEAESSRTTEQGKRNIADLASERIRARLKRLLARGEEVTADSDPAELHELRIQCKRLRYLLEMFRGLYREQKLRKAVADLKNLQDVLGHVNDLSVHSAFVEAVGREEADALEAPTLLAMGRLCAELERERERVGQSFFTRFQRFTKNKRIKQLRKALVVEGSR